MIKKIWEQNRSLIQWLIVALLVLLLVIWMRGEEPESDIVDVAPVPVTAPAPVPDTPVELKPAPSESIPAPEPEPAIETTPEPAPTPEPIPEPAPEPVETPEPVVEDSSVELICPEWTESTAVSRGSFTRGVDRNRREPVDSVCLLGTDEHKIFYFSDLHNQFGKEIYHLWEYGGNAMAKVSLGRVRGPRWRVWSSKNLVPGWTGEWTVKVITKNGTVLHQESFTYR